MLPRILQEKTKYLVKSYLMFWMLLLRRWQRLGRCRIGLVIKYRLSLGLLRRFLSMVLSHSMPFYNLYRGIFILFYVLLLYECSLFWVEILVCWPMWNTE